MNRNSSWSISNNSTHYSSNAESSQVMAWARDKATGEPMYIMELDSNHTGANCDCECPSCDLPLVAVNAAKKEYRIRPHFRHPDGAIKSDCMYLSARLAALQLLRTEGFILLPKIRRSGTAVGLSGTAYEAWIERPTERVFIRDFNFNDKTAAILTLDDGRKLRFELFGDGAKIASDGGHIASIRLNLTDPAIAGMDIEELRSRISLIPDGMCWLSHWNDQEMIAEAKAEANRKADDFMDLQSRYSDDLEGIDKKFRRETVLHWEVKNILAESMELRVPSLDVFAIGCSDSGVKVKREWARNVEVIPLLSVQTEKRLGCVIPDIIAKTHHEHGGTLLVEVTVTNHIDNQRLNRIKDQNLPTLEIDLSRSGGLVSRSELKTIVVDGLELKKWLHHPEIANRSLILEAEITAEVKRINDAEHAKQEYIKQVLNTPIQEIIAEYLDAITKLADFDTLDSMSSDAIFSKESTNYLLKEIGKKLAIFGYPEALDDELTTGRQGIIPRILSIKIGRGVGYKLNSTMEVMNAIKQSSNGNSTNHTIYMIAEKVYRHGSITENPEWYAEWVNVVKRSLRSGSKTYRRDTKFDGFLSLLFPELKDPLSKKIKEVKKINPSISDANLKIQQNKEWWAKNQASHSNIDNKVKELIHTYRYFQINFNQVFDDAKTIDDVNAYLKWFDTWNIRYGLEYKVNPIAMVLNAAGFSGALEQCDIYLRQVKSRGISVARSSVSNGYASSPLNSDKTNLYAEMKGRSGPRKPN